MILRNICRKSVFAYSLKYNRSLFARNFARHSQQKADDDAPIPYTKSLANQWRAESSRSGEDGEPRLWYEPYVLMGSIAVFMVYFCILREENEVDQELGMSLYSRIKGLEEHQLRMVLEYDRSRGKNTADIEKRLKEIEAAKQHEDT